MSSFITVMRIRLVMDSIHTQNSLATWKMGSSWQCRCGIEGEMCSESWGGGCCAGGWSSEQRLRPLCTFGMQRGTPPLTWDLACYKSFELTLSTRVLKMVLSCLYLLVQYWTSHLFVDSKFVFPFSCALPGTGKHMSGNCCYWQLSDW